MEKVFAVIWSVLSLCCAVISIRQFRERGFLFHNAYIWVSKQEREGLNKKPYYRQAAIAFALTAVIFFLMAFAFWLAAIWLWLVIGAIAAALLVYVISAASKEADQPK